MGGVLLNAHTLGQTYLSFLHISHLRGGEIYTLLTYVSFVAALLAQLYRTCVTIQQQCICNTFLILKLDWLTREI